MNTRESAALDCERDEKETNQVEPDAPSDLKTAQEELTAMREMYRVIEEATARKISNLQEEVRLCNTKLFTCQVEVCRYEKACQRKLTAVRQIHIGYEQQLAALQDNCQQLQEHQDRLQRSLQQREAEVLSYKKRLVQQAQSAPQGLFGAPHSGVRPPRWQMSNAQQRIQELTEQVAAQQQQLSQLQDELTEKEFELSAATRESGWGFDFPSSTCSSTASKQTTDSAAQTNAETASSTSSVATSTLAERETSLNREQHPQVMVVFKLDALECDGLVQGLRSQVAALQSQVQHLQQGNLYLIASRDQDRQILLDTQQQLAAAVTELQTLKESSKFEKQEEQAAAECGGLAESKCLSAVRVSGTLRDRSSSSSQPGTPSTPELSVEPSFGTAGVISSSSGSLLSSSSSLEGGATCNESAMPGAGSRVQVCAVATAAADTSADEEDTPCVSAAALGEEGGSDGLVAHEVAVCEMATGMPISLKPQRKIRLQGIRRCVFSTLRRLVSFRL